ncbi:hypothetical protein QTP88_029060 [Uroleucon formosanum]
MDVRSIRGNSAISDHFLVRVKIHFRISVEKQRRNSGKKRINRDILKTDVVKLNQDRLIEELQRINQESDINNTWEKVEQVIEDTSERILGNTQKEKKQNMQVNKEKQKKTLRMARRLREKQRVTEVENNNNKNNIKAFFEKIKNVKTGYRPKTLMIRKDDGTIITDKGKIAN